MALPIKMLRTIMQLTRHPVTSKPFASAILLARHQHKDIISSAKSENVEANESLDQFDMDLNPFSRVDQSKAAFVEDLVPPLKRSFNLAAYVNSSETLQQLVKLGVSLFDIENTHLRAARHLVLLDFQTECLPYIKLLVDIGLKEKNIGRFISEYPHIFQVPLSDLNVRLKYLESKGFSRLQVAEAINRSCQILSNNVKTLDYKLGVFQLEFVLPAKFVREIVSSYPPVIAIPDGQYKLINFTLIEEFGFKRQETHLLLRNQPKILDILRPVLISRLELLHNTMGLSHKTICKFPKLVTGPIMEIRHRYEYLERLKRNQFDPTKPLYVPPSALYNPDDQQFCERYAKTTLEDYKLFLRNQ